MMPVSVSMHACSVWPVDIDFTVFGFFLKGYSVEETVEQLMALQSVTPEKAQARRRTSSAASFPSTSSNASSVSSSSSSALSQGLPNNSADLYSPTSSVPQGAHTRDTSGRRRDSRSSDNKGSERSVATSSPHFITNESELLTEDKRVSLEDELAEELTLSPAMPKSLVGALIRTGENEEAPTLAVPSAAAGITAVDTSTNATRPASSRPPHPTAGNDNLSTKLPTQQQQQQPQQQPLSGATTVHARQRQHHRHHHRHRSGVHESPAGNSANDSSSRNKKKHRRHTTNTTTTRLSTVQHTATTSATTSFALPSMWGYESNVNGAPSLQHTRHNSAMPSVEDFAAADGTAAKGNSGSGGEGKNSLLENRRTSRQKRRKEQQCFFLNEDYIKFQRQLQEVEAIGGAGAGASSLQSRFLFEEVTEQFQAFRELAREEQLGSPYAFLSNYYMPIPIAARLELLRMYYEADPGLLRWAFGDKLNRFDLPGALAAAREEFVSGTLSPSNVGGGVSAGNGGGNSSSVCAVGATATAAGIGGGVASFWSGRWKSSPGKLATMDALTLMRLSEQHTDALRRQWENVKHVCITVAALYRGRGGICVPLDMSLLTTIQQVFGLRQEQALDYATAAFGYEHRLETRLFDRLNTFSEYGAICSIVASVWCDDSGYFLSEPFRDGCRRVGRLLDEYRLLSELHPLIFGEPMRPRWQVQLDEVQRVITTSSLVEKNTMVSATAVAAGSPVASAASPTALSVSGGSYNSVASLGGGGAAGGGGYTNVNLSSSGSLGGGGGGYRAGAGDGVSVPPSASTAAAINGSSSSSNANVHSPFSGNGQYSRRFLMEFPSLMKQLLRICVALGNNGGVNDALDIFFTRIYSYLEVLSVRSAPAIVSMVMNATGSGALASVTLPTATLHGSFAGGGLAGAPGVSSANVGKPPLPPHGERVRGHAESARVGAGHAVSGQETNVNTNAAHASPPALSTSGLTSPLRRSHSSGSLNYSIHNLPKSSSTPSLASTLGGGERGGLMVQDALSPAGTTATTAAYGSEGCARGTGSDDVLLAGSAIPYAASTVVNTSLFHPASALIPLSAAFAAHHAANSSANNNTAGSFVSSPLTAAPSGRGFGAEDERTQEWSTTVTAGAMYINSGSNANAGVPTSAFAGAAGVRSHNPSFTGVGGGSGSGGVGGGASAAASALVTSQVGDMVRKAVDKRYLRELCMLLAALPKAWRQLTTLIPEDHAATDKTVTDLAMALKAITQVLMASDDFH
jgi:hypothetical protein